MEFNPGKHTRNAFETLQMATKRAETADLQVRRGADPTDTLENVKNLISRAQNEIDEALKLIREQKEVSERYEQTKPNILKQMDILRRQQEAGIPVGVQHPIGFQRELRAPSPPLIPEVRAPIVPRMEAPTVRAPSPRPVVPALRPVSPPRGNLQAMTVTQLKDLARQRGLKGYSTKRKDELIAMLQ